MLSAEQLYSPVQKPGRPMAKLDDTNLAISAKPARLPLDPTLANARVLLVRHARSEFNSAEAHVRERMGEGDATEADLIKLQINPDLLDCPLDSMGVAQTEKGALQAGSLPHVHTVLTSPLRRCLETTWRLFKDHPNF